MKDELNTLECIKSRKYCTVLKAMKDHEELSLMPMDSGDYKNVEPETFLVLQWLRLHIAKVGYVSSRSKLIGLYKMIKVDSLFHSFHHSYNKYWVTLGPKSWLIGKDSDAGRDWGQEEKGTTEDEMAGWHHRLDGRESLNSGSWWWTGRPGVLWFMGSQRVGHDWATELNWTEGLLRLWMAFFSLILFPQLLNLDVAFLFF